MVRAVLRFLFLLLIQFLFAFIALLLNPLKKTLPSELWIKILKNKQRWARCCCWCLNIHVTIEGSVPERGPRLIVANHVGSPDIYILGMLVRGFFVSKADVGTWPVVGGMMMRGGTLLVDRDRRQLARNLRDSISSRLKQGHGVILFPEGRASDGSELLSFKPAGFQAAVDASCPVLPVAITYHDGNSPSVACWSERSFMQHLWALLMNNRLDVTVKFLPEILPGNDRKVLAEKSHEAISKSIFPS